MTCKREDSHKKTEIPSSWRKPQGNNSRARMKEEGSVQMPGAGQRTPKEHRGKHPSGMEETLVENVKQVQEVDEGILRISSTVGGRKKQKIIEKAEQKDLNIANP